MLKKTMSLTSLNVDFKASISICLICLLMCLALNSNQNPRAHGGRQGYRFDIVSLDARGLDRLDLVHERSNVGRQLVFLEAELADAGVDIASLIGAVFHLASLEFSDGGRHVGARSDHGAGFGCRHEAARP